MDLKQISDKVKNNPKILVIFGISIIVLIMLTSFIEFPSKDEEEVKLNADIYAEQLEDKLEETIVSVNGGSANVIVTLETGIEYIYASQVKSDESVKENADTKNSQTDGSKDESYVIITDQDGKEQALVVTEIMPKIKGVVVSCSGGDNEYVSAKITSVITTALNISEDMVCVVGIK